jgi:hypothetical protein
VPQQQALAAPATATPSVASASPPIIEPQLRPDTGNETRQVAHVTPNNAYGQISHGSMQQPDLKPSWSTPPSADPPKVPQKAVDAASITDWSIGLRCIMKTVAQNDAILQRIRKV